MRKDPAATRFDVKGDLGSDIRSKSTVRVIRYAGIIITCLEN
jgi:hypothetical protein